jgi:hypothetical protein
VTAFPRLSGLALRECMSVKVILETVDGKREAEVVDFDYVLANIWPVGDDSFRLLQYVDLYGNTIFNRQQMGEVEKELDVLLQRVVSNEQKETLLRIRSLASRCKEHPHWFLRFRGD